MENVRELTETVYIHQDDLDTIDDYIENGGLNEDESVSVTAHFPDGKFVDVVVCSNDEEEPAWTQAVLFNENGNQIGWTEPDFAFDGEWIFWTKDAVYTVLVEVSNRAERLCV